MRDSTKSSTSRLHLAAAEQNGFTFTELLVAIAVLAVVVVLAIPARAKLNTQTGIAQCSDYARRLGVAMLSLANDSTGQFPQNADGSLPWNLPASPANKLVQYGLSPRQFYCPANMPPDLDAGFWSSTFTTVKLLGYALTLPSTTVLNLTNQNPSLIPSPSSTGSPRAPAVPPSIRVLVADTTVCASVGSPSQTNAGNYTWTQLSVNNVSAKLSTSHMNCRTNLPAGGNVGMLDGHVEWRPFGNMLPRTFNNGTSPPVFWW